MRGTGRELGQSHSRAAAATLSWTVQKQASAPGSLTGPCRRGAGAPRQLAGRALERAATEGDPPEPTAGDHRARLGAARVRARPRL